MSKIVTLSEAGSIALHAMVLIAQKDKMTNVIEIAEETGSSKHHVAKVMQRLVKDKFLSSTRGPAGGFVMLKKPGEITLLEIYESIEGSIGLSDCIMEKQICPFTKCILNNIAKKMTADFIDYMKNQTLDKYL